MSDGLKLFKFDDDALDSLGRGVDIVAQAVGSTLGPRGRTVIIAQPDSSPIVTKDGVTVARSIRLRDRFADLGAQVVKEAAVRACDEAGDGTTTATVLTKALFTEGRRALGGGVPLVELKDDITRSIDTLRNELVRMSRSVADHDELVSVATVASNGDVHLGQLIADAIETVGVDGVVTVEESGGYKTSVSTTEGASIDRGYLSPHFVTDSDKMLCELKSPLVLLTNKKLSSMRELVPLMERCLQADRALLIFADDVEGEVLQGLVTNKMRGILRVCAVKAPEFGASRVPALTDLGLLLGCELFVGTDEELAALQLEDLGSCDVAIVRRDSTTLIRPQGERSGLERRIAALNDELSNAEEDAAAVLARRLTRLASKVSVIRVGGATEFEVRERRDRVDDAIQATRAALREGILPGGGSALIRAAQSSLGPRPSSAGESVVVRAAAAPLRQMLQNAGMSDSDVVGRLVSRRDGRCYDIRSLSWKDPFDAGIVDPTIVVRSSLEHAASAAIILLSVGASVVNDE